MTALSRILLLACHLVPVVSPAAELPLHEPLNPKRIAELASPAVVLIRAQANEENFQATGFVANSSGSIVTALHVLDRATKVRVSLPDGQRFEDVSVLAFDVEQDIAVVGVELKQDTGTLTVLPFGSATSILPGEAVVVISNPFGLTLTVTQGIVSAWRESKDDDWQPEPDDETSVMPLPSRRLLQISAAISPGSSGGPVFNDRGQVIGIAMAGILYGMADLNFAVPADDVPKLLLQGSPMDLASFHRQVARARLDLARPFLEKARLAYDRDETTTALKLLEKALVLFPGYEEALLLAGDLRMAAGELGEAERLFRRAVQANEESIEGWYRLGNLYDQMASDTESLDMMDRAQSAYERCLSLDAQHAQAAYGLALLHLRRGNLVEAEQLLLTATESRGTPPGAHALLGLVLLRRGRLVEAEAALSQALWEDPEQPLPYFGLAQVSMLQENTRGDAARYWVKFLDLSRGKPSLRREREIAIRIVERYFPELIRP